MIKFILIAIILSASPLLVGESADGASIGVGLAGVDNMDGRMSPAATARFGWTETYYSQLFYWGSDFGPVTERYYVATFGAEVAVRGSKYFAAHYGLAASKHDLSLYTNEASRKSGNQTEAFEETDYNVGGVLGVGLKSTFGPIRAELNWDSHIYFTGSSAIVFLTSARKQSISAVFGVDL